jgi:hypothetical protein
MTTNESNERVKITESLKFTDMAIEDLALKKRVLIHQRSLYF